LHYIACTNLDQTSSPASAMQGVHAERLARLAGHLAPTQASLQQSPTAAGGEPRFSVAVLGAAGGIGQPLALLLKGHPAVGELRLYDVVGTAGVGADIGHINTQSKVTAHMGAEELSGALYGADLVVIPAGVPRKPGMTRDDLFNTNAGIVQTLCEGIAKYCPRAWVAIISNPVNSTVPIAAEVFKRAGTYDPRKLLGVTKLDVVRAQQFIGEILAVDPATVAVPVVGGHAGVTILPLLSQAVPRLQLPQNRVKALTERIQDAGTEVVKAKAGKGSATLSMAYAAAAFADSCLKAMAGQPGVEECAYVQSHAHPRLPFFASRLRLGREGVADILPLGQLSAYEEEGLKAVEKELAGSIQKGIDFVAGGSKK
jgi:malate dehydrogenase